MENDSILGNIKQMLGVPLDVSVFDNDIISAIQVALLTIAQLGIGNPEGTQIDSVNQIWSDITWNNQALNAVKTLVYLKTKLIFDPPGTSYLIEAIERQITEIEWRLLVQVEHVDPPPEEEEVV